ncbi:multidrug effflux MFS transporter [Halomonas beimenensis]|uniref:Bcr/CflA family efflux transporter n=1 Tax=Halomonas beimenensis TaxID=475662 RepID=A0A291P2D1_9GAMM|nr:multidrug effflux MFS transporter [Halomonas beimenensis]ATJ81028.1 multidrug resistance transporter, Bcr/CflA family [Halomonas beimenensis]
MLRPTSPATVVLLAALTALGPLATDMYLPAMPAMAAALDAGPDQVQLTLSLYMAGFALAQLICGPLADRFGRKPVLIGGLALFLATSMLCALAQSIEALLLGRFLQALGGSVGPVLGRAMVRDIHGPTEAGRILSYMAIAMAVAPAVAPVAGAGLLVVFGWPAVFWLLAGYTLLILALIAGQLPETLAPTQRRSIQPLALLATFRMLLGERRFVGYTLTNAAVFSGLFAFLSGSSFVLVDFMGLKPTDYGLLFTLVVLGFVSGSLISGRYSHRLGRERLLALGTLACALGGGSMAALSLAGVFAPWAVVAPQVLFVAGFGIVMPQSMSGALAPHPECAGSASSLFGFLQMSIAALAGALVGRLHDGTSHSMAIAIGLAGLVAVISYWGLVRRAGTQRRPAPAPLAK